MKDIIIAVTLMTMSEREYDLGGVYKKFPGTFTFKWTPIRADIQEWLKIHRGWAEDILWVE